MDREVTVPNIKEPIFKILEERLDREIGNNRDIIDQIYTKINSIKPLLYEEDPRTKDKIAENCFVNSLSYKIDLISYSNNKLEAILVCLKELLG